METRRVFLKKATIYGMSGIIAAGVAPAYAINTRVRKTGVSMEDAWKVHRKCLIIDGHNDTPVERVAQKKNVSTMMQRDMAHQMDVPRMKEAGFDAGSFIVGNGLVANVWVTMEQTLSTIAAKPKDLMLVLSSKDVVSAQKHGKVGIIMGIEGAAKWLNGETDILRMLYRNGLRLLGISHGEGGKEPASLQGSRSLVKLGTPGERETERRNAVGLTPFGKDILKLCNELGILVDLSHINDKAFYDVMEMATKPVIVSHTAAFSVCNHYRCLTDDQIKALAANGGAMGIIFEPEYLSPNPEQCTMDTMVDHICHVIDLVGINHVGIGSDYDGGVTAPVVPEISQLVNLTRYMLERGLTENEIQKIWGGNFFRVLQKTIDHPEITN